MVDLVKIRKKAKEKAARAAADQVADRASQAEPVVAGRGSRVAGEARAAAATAKTVTAAEKKTHKATVQKEAIEPAAKSAPAAKKAPPPADAIPDTRQTAVDKRQAPAGDGQPITTAQLTSKLARFLETAGERRVERTQDSQGGAEAQVELLTFAIASELYAIAIDAVVEIVTPRAVTRIPNSDPLVVGILSLRGMIVTLIDAHRRLGHRRPDEVTPDSRVIVVQLDHQTLGFAVDRVLRVVKIAAAAVEPHPVVHASEQDDSVRGVFRHADSLTILLDLDKLLNTRAEAAPA